MKIALIDPSLFTWPYDRALAEGLRAEGHEVRLYGRHLAPEDSLEAQPGELLQFFYPGLAAQKRASLPRGLYLWTKGFSHIASMARLLRELRAWRPDVIHLQWLPLPLADGAFLPLLRKVAPVILTIHDTIPFNATPVALLQRAGMPGAARRCDALIVHTQEAKQRLTAQKIDPARISVIPHGLLHQDKDLSRLPPTRAKGEEETVEILQFGKIKPYKGVDLLIRAVALIPAEIRQKLKIRVVGKAYLDISQLVRLAKSLGVTAQFDFAFRFVTEEEMRALFTAADALVMPYRQIDASGVLMTAIAAGRPIIASKIGAFAELLQDGTHGYLLPPEDVGALAHALCEIASHSERRLEMAAQVRALAEAIPTWRDIGAMTIALYHHVRQQQENTDDAHPSRHHERRVRH